MLLADALRQATAQVVVARGRARDKPGHKQRGPTATAAFSNLRLCCHRFFTGGVSTIKGHASVSM